MPKRGHGELPLPAGWDMARDYDGKIYFIDHNNQQTTWVDPRDKLTKPATFADCIGNELPLGWEQAYDPLIGIYYIDHINQRTQIEDPHLTWRAYQEAMLRDYLSTATEELQAKKETADVKEKRLLIALDEYKHLTSLNGLHSASSTSSLSSTASGRYDPDLLKQDVGLAKLRVLRLKQELQQIRQEVSQKECGLNTLAEVDQKLANGNCFSVDEAQAIMNELRCIQKSLISGEKERAEIMQSLARHKHDLTRLLVTKDSDPSTLSIPAEKFSRASQTDLPGELVPLGARLAEMTRLRLQYDHTRKEVLKIQRRLSELEENIDPGDMESDKDRLLLFQEKEQLLRELKSQDIKSRPSNEIAKIRLEIKRLEEDLRHAAEMARKNITDRLKLHDEKQGLLSNLKEALNSMASLESRLRSLSASTLSVSSSSSLASLSSSQASSKGSLSSLSFTDIYGTPSTNPESVSIVDLYKKLLQGLHNNYSITCDSFELNSSANVPKCNSNNSISSLNLQDRVASLDSMPCGSGGNFSLQLGPNGPSHQSLPSLSPRSSLSSVSPPVSPYEAIPPPSYEQAYLDKKKKGALESKAVEDAIAELSLRDENVEKCDVDQASSYPIPPPLSPISEYVPHEDSTGDELQEDTSRLQSSGTNTRSVSAAVSDESVAGDSGVFEASNRKALLICDTNVDTVQIQVKLRYCVSNEILIIGIERLRNVGNLFVPESHKICIKAAVLPAIPGVGPQVRTEPVDAADKLKLGEEFPISLSLNKLFGKTLQINVFGVSQSGAEHCLGCSQVSLADFNPDSTSIKWYNVLSSNVMSVDRSSTLGAEKLDAECIKYLGSHYRQESDISVLCSLSCARNNVTKEESSDESTIISSQTSTLTRNPERDMMLQNELDKWYTKGTGGDLQYGSKAVMDSRNEGETDDETFGINMLEDAYDGYEDEEGPETEDKSTNTEFVFVETKSHKGHGHGYGSSSTKSLVKRSQTFSPSNVVNKNEYICRLNRSDSDSSMQVKKSGHSNATPISGAGMSSSLSSSLSSSVTPSSAAFQRGSMERRSLRWKKATTLAPALPSSHTKPPTRAMKYRTSIDLELDRQAQQQRLLALHNEIKRLKALKDKLQAAKATGDSATLSVLLESERLKELMPQTSLHKLTTSQCKEAQKMESLWKKAWKDIYKLRKSRTPSGKIDLVSFKEKMAFFTLPTWQQAEVDCSIPDPSQWGNMQLEDIAELLGKEVESNPTGSADDEVDRRVESSEEYWNSLRKLMQEEHVASLHSLERSTAAAAPSSTIVIRDKNVEEIGSGHKHFSCNSSNSVSLLHYAIGAESKLSEEGNNTVIICKEETDSGVSTGTLDSTTMHANMSASNNSHGCMPTSDPIGVVPIDQRNPSNDEKSTKRRVEYLVQL